MTSLPDNLGKNDPAGNGDIERVQGYSTWDVNYLMTPFSDRIGKPFILPSQDQDYVSVPIALKYGFRF